MLVALGASPARAETVTVLFSGIVTEVNIVELEAFFQVGEPFDGYFQVDDTTPDSQPSPTFGDYPGATSFRFEIGDDAVTAPTGFVEVGDGEPLGGNVVDFYRGAVVCSGATPCVGTFGDYAPLQLELVLIDGSASVYSDDSLPGELSLADFDDVQATVAFTSDLSSGRVTASLDSVTLTVPEPAAPLLLGAGACLLAAARGRRRR